MTEDHVEKMVKRGFVSSEDVNSRVFVDNSLRNNKARWSFSDGRLYVSQAARTLLLDPETFLAALEGLEIDWYPGDVGWYNF
ncbi:hypothetical protein LC612_38725 [Nostoc sp. CHAB 5834]|nr:hypothetical protein [Nostoc sp. CHAB 5834]